MPTQTFQWKPELGAQRSKSPLVDKVQFGDGYEVRQESGINSNPTKWSCSFVYNAPTAGLILDFLDARRAVEAFSWVDPLGKTGMYVCREWDSSQIKFGVFEIKATFEQVFEVAV